MITRRGFFGLFGAAAVAAVVKPTYFFAPIGGWTSDSIINPYEPDLIINPYDLWADPLTPEMVDSSLFGLRYYQVATGFNWLGIQRASYPGKLAN